MLVGTPLLSPVPLGLLLASSPLMLLSISVAIILASSLPLMNVRLLLLHGPLGFGHTLCQYPSLSCSCSVWQGFMLAFHAGTAIRIEVRFLSFDILHMISLDPIWALMPLMVHVIPTSEAVVQVEEPFMGIAEWGIGVVSILVTTASLTSSASSSEGLLLGSIHVGAASKVHVDGGISVVVSLWFLLLVVASLIDP